MAKLKGHLISFYLLLIGGRRREPTFRGLVTLIPKRLHYLLVLTKSKNLTEGLKKLSKIDFNSMQIYIEK